MINRKTLFNIGSALIVSIGLAGAVSAQQTVSAPVVVNEAPKTAEAITKVVDTGGQTKIASTETVVSTYSVPLLNIPSLNNKTLKIKVNFTGELQGLRGKASIKPQTDGTSEIKMDFEAMKMAPKDKRIILWAVAADRSYIKIGQVISSGLRDKSEIRGETSLKDFGLFVTQEDTNVDVPTNTRYTNIRANKY
jgi:hypothetical protein